MGEAPRELYRRDKAFLGGEQPFVLTSVPQKAPRGAPPSAPSRWSFAESPPGGGRACDHQMYRRCRERAGGRPFHHRSRSVASRAWARMDLDPSFRQITVVGACQLCQRPLTVVLHQAERGRALGADRARLDV